ncbi:heme-binding protein [Microdochium nivale]|nr:heme-binding protein [Microdochium nivale]
MRNFLTTLHPPHHEIRRAPSKYHVCWSIRVQRARSCWRPPRPQVPLWRGDLRAFSPLGEDAPLGVLDAFNGTFAGTGFNTIFRPNSVAPTTTGYPKDFPNPIIPAPPSPPNISVLELNLTQEELAFSDPLGSVPNRGLGLQNDISINGVTYLQVVNDVTNTATGKGDGKPTGIHTETGFWLNVPKTDNNPNMTDTLVRLGSIPHGTTINAQSKAATVTPGPPAISKRCITPFVIGDPADTQWKHSQKVNLTNTPRLPQDLKKFVAAGTITQRYLDNSSNILLDINEQLNIISTCTFDVTTQSDPPPTPANGDNSTSEIPGGGTANIAFLVGGAGGAGPNANAVRMSATFWVEVVSSIITILPRRR